MHRRSFLAGGLAAATGLALAPDLWRAASAAPAVPGPGPYGALLPADANGVQLPAGFTSRIVARGEQPVAGTSGIWHRFPDGGATFADGEGWVYVSNSEVPGAGGAGALRFDAEGNVVDTYRILTGTSMNCAGGPTPWGTWLSCEEHPLGRVWQCEPGGLGQGTVQPMLGAFAHEAVTVDPDRRHLYLTEDDGAGCFYRFTPDAYPDLGAGTLEAAVVDGAGAVTWIEVDPLVPMAGQRPDSAARFDGGEGVWYDAGHVYFTTKGDNRVWDLDVATQRLTVLYDAAELGDAAPLTGVDNVVMSRSGDLVVAEDGGNLELVIISREREVAPIVRLEGHEGSEITGPAFDPSGRRLYFSSQRSEGGTGAGVTFEVSGPFRGASQPVPTPAAPTPAAPTPAAPAPAASGGGSLPATGAERLAPVGLGLLGAAAAAWAIRSRATD